MNFFVVVLNSHRDEVDIEGVEAAKKHVKEVAHQEHAVCATDESKIRARNNELVTFSIDRRMTACVTQRRLTCIQRSHAYPLAKCHESVIKTALATHHHCT